MKKRLRIFSILVIVFFTAFACKKENVGGDSDEKILAKTPTNEVLSDIEAKPLSAISTEFKTYNKQDAPKAHAKYLNDPMKFADFDYSDEVDKSRCFGVVGSDVCKFYEGAELHSIADVKNLADGIPVPIGTVFELFSAIGLPAYNSTEIKTVLGRDYRNLEPFEFEDERHVFFETEYEGKKGLIFGSDLSVKSLGESELYNHIASLLYQGNGKFENFIPTESDKKLSPEVIESLEKNKLAFVSVPHTISYYNDILELYYNPNNPFQSVFITSDLISHAKHIIFDESLQKAEEDFFIPKLYTLVDDFLEKLSFVNTAQSSITASDETLQKAIDYFNVAKALIELSPDKKEGKNEYGMPETTYYEKNADEILAKYNKTVQAEIALMNKAAGYNQSPIFTFKDGSSNSEDYSQYKTRGHYTKNGRLGTYFKVMMWFGRTNFIISNGLHEGQNDVSSTEELSKNTVPIALLINEIANKNAELYKAWQDIFDPLTALIGLSDDLSFYDCLPLWRNLHVADLKEWSKDEKNITEFLDLTEKELLPPAVSGTSLYKSASSGTKDNRKPAMGFRLFGQRYTLDAFIFTKTTAPRTPSRTMVSSLDIFSCLGSEYAENILSEQYEKFPELQSTVKAFKTEIANAEAEKVFSKTYYGSVLQEIATLVRFEKGSGFYFTESPYWNIKQINTSLGVLAELKHDTILYAKQAASEMGGGSDFTYRSKPIPEFINYVEPNLPYFENVLMSLYFLKEIYSEYELADENTFDILDKFIEINQNLIKIVKLEIMDKPIEASDNRYLKERIFDELVYCVTFGKKSSPLGLCFCGPVKTSAIVADVFTDNDNEQVLEFGTGVPHKIYVPINDGQGGKRIAIGYAFNAYEFIQPQNNRLNDEQWREKVYNTSVHEMQSFKPEWLKVPFAK